jgi:hypothetical protein
MKSASCKRHIENHREKVGVSTVSFGSKNEATPNYSSFDRPESDPPF